jgi:Asp-tRNA(Asn)/Glu-tRNA(Gln) amidotransferase A subunit family amidase
MGLPLGVHFVGELHQDDKLLSVAAGVAALLN